MSLEDPQPELNPPSPSMPGKLREAAKALGLDDPSCEAFSKNSAAAINGTPLFVMPIPTRVATGFNGMLVASLQDFKLTQVAQAEVLLNANMVLGPATGLNFSMLPDGGLQLTCGFHGDNIDGPWLANMMVQMSSIVAGLRKDLETIAGPQPSPHTDKAVTAWP